MIRIQPALQRRPEVVVPVADPHEERAVRSVGKPKPWARPLWIGHGVERLVHVFTSTKHIELMRRWWLNAACIGDMINEGERAWQQTTKGTRSGSAEEIVPVAPLANLTTGEQATRSWGSLF